MTSIRRPASALKRPSAYLPPPLLKTRETPKDVPPPKSAKLQQKPSASTSASAALTKSQLPGLKASKATSKKERAVASLFGEFDDDEEDEAADADGEEEFEEEIDLDGEPINKRLWFLAAYY